MQARSFSFLKIEVLLLLLIPLLSAGCANRLVWGLPADTLAERIDAGDFDLLTGIDWEKEDPAEAFRLGPQAPFYLSFAFQSLDSPETARKLLELSWARTKRPWKDEAGVLLASGQLADKDYARAIATARGVLALQPPAEASLTHRARRVLAEALYWNRDDALAIEEAVRLGEGEPEALLFRAVSAARLGRPEARELFLTLFLRSRLSQLHARAYVFLTSDPASLARILALRAGAPGGEVPSHAGKLGEGNRPGGKRAGIALERAAGRRHGDRGAGHCLRICRRQAGGARFMESLASRLTGQPRADSLEQAGRLYRRAKEYPKALATLRAAAGAARLSEQQDRVRWYVLDILFATEPKDLLEQLAAEAAQWNVPSYFADLLEERIAELVSARKWAELARMHEALVATGPDAIVAQLSYILARARQEGLVTRLPGSPPGSARDYFHEAARLNSTGYYGIMAGSRLGELPSAGCSARGDL